MTTEPRFIALPLACAAISALVTWLAIRYARRNALFDLPGQRRSHSVPTPRGGGIGIVAAVLAGLAFNAIGGHLRSLCEPAMAAVALVAAVGWIDDHRGLGVRIRLLAHLFAVAVLYFPLFQLFALLSSLQPIGAGQSNPGAMPAASWLVLSLAALVFVLANVWFVNLHNFMDGINGLLASQAIFVFLVLSWLVPGDGGALLLLCAAATAGFLPFNFPRARIFMGDVGSGALGLLIAGAVVLQALSFHGSAFSGLIACSAFVADASWTLLSRMLRGRRWYSAHREHLYQWLVRSGFSHARVVAFYMAWNLFVVVPVLYVIDRSPGPAFRARDSIWTLAVYALASATWFAGKRWCLRRVKPMKKQEV